MKVLSIGAHNDEIMADMGGTAYLLHKQGCEQLFLNVACQWNDDTITENTESLLALSADVVLKQYVNRETDYKNEQFALIHPGGAVGEKLHENHKEDKQ